MKVFHSAALCCLVIGIYACSPKIVAINQEVVDKHGNPILVGKSSRARLEQAPYDAWFSKNYNEYRVDSSALLALKRALKNKKLYLFIGTWCGDSRREAPRLYKILDCCGFSPAQVQLITVSNADTAYKQSPTHEEKGLDIIRVPTLLVAAHNKEIGRIVETPVVSWEKDLLAILTGKPYQPRYSKEPYKTRPISIH